MENLKFVFDELIVAKLISSIYCLGVFMTVSTSSDSSGNKSYKFESESRRAPKGKKHFTEGSAVDALQEMSGVNKFKVSTFYVIIHQLNNALKQRIKS